MSPSHKEKLFFIILPTNGLLDHKIDLSLILRETSMQFLKTAVLDAGQDSKVKVLSVCE